MGCRSGGSRIQEVELDFLKYKLIFNMDRFLKF